LSEIEIGSTKQTETGTVTKTKASNSLAGDRHHRHCYALARAG
jgi:hypothetical protein